MLFRVLPAAALLAVLVAGAELAHACSRVLWNDNGQAVVVGRNMDWPEGMLTDLWAFPRGIARSGLSGDDNSLTRTSKYGSLGAAVYNIGTADGINEKGLIANLLWLAEADYGKRDVKLPGLSPALRAQYSLDKFATVAESDGGDAAGKFQIVTAAMPGYRESHRASVARRCNRRFRCHRDRRRRQGAHLSRPLLHGDDQLAAVSRTARQPEAISRLRRHAPLLGTSEAADRFVRAAYYLTNQTKPRDYRQTIVRVLSIMRNAAQPFVQPDPNRPAASHTIWRAVADATNRMYFYESTLSPNIVWVRLDGLDFSAGAPVRKLDLVHGGDLVGDVTSSFKPSAPFAFRKGGS